MDRKRLTTRKAFRFPHFSLWESWLDGSHRSSLPGFLGRMLGLIGVGWNLLGRHFPGDGILYCRYLQNAFFPAGRHQSGLPEKGPGLLSLSASFWGLPWDPCSFAFMAPILGIVFSSAGTQMIFALSLVFIIHHCHAW